MPMELLNEVLFILCEAIVKACKEDFRQWTSKLPEAVFADQVTIS